MCVNFFSQWVSLTGLCSDYKTKPSVSIHCTDIVHVCDPAHSLHTTFFLVFLDSPPFASMDAFLRIQHASR